MSRDLRPLNVSADSMERGEARRHSHPGVLGPDFTSPFSSNTINDALRDIKRGMSFTGAVVSSGLRLPEIAGLPLTTTSREPMLTFDDRLEETAVLESLEADILRDESHCQGPYENSGGDAQVDCLTILTFNAGLLDYRVCGISVYTNPAFASRRLGHMPISLRSSEADIVALQEVYEHSHADAIIESLRLIYPFHARRASGGCLAMHNGLLVLSKFPITTSKFHKFTSATMIESIFASKGILETTIVVPGVGQICLLNVHLASGAVNPESEQMENLRNKQLAQVLDIVRTVTRRKECPVLMGDLNAAPDLCGSTYNLLESRGWEDLFYRAQISTLCKSLGDGDWVDRTTSSSTHSGYDESSFYTWTPQNPLNAAGPHSDCQGSRCDHIFLPPTELRGGLAAFHCEAAGIMFQAVSYVLVAYAAARGY
ncbi:MAG: uncharacterized protein KVP18_000500 [Porospora cf. gigantea A]|uniref:uncharacterized protein n=1 Tax=Porospora cf. gigantea A TaxID=2853593 RepID=UPI003559A48A|nr:MAG: hypothetical protein KVP18_000500 [Porospora cf. gigantea A]